MDDTTNRRGVLVGTALGLSTVLAGCASSDDSTNGGNGGDNPNGDDGNENGERPDDPEVIELEGGGQEVTDPFSVGGGITGFHMEHHGSGNFIVDLIDEATGESEMLANEIGVWNGNVPTGLTAGEYILDVEGDGEWGIEIHQPREDGPYTPEIDVGTNVSEYVGPFGYSGTYTISADFSGDGNFIVTLLDKDGYMADLVFNEIGSFSGQTTFNYSGEGWISVEANGEWHLEIE